MTEITIVEIIQTILGLAITVLVPLIGQYIQEKRKNEKFNQAIVYSKLAVAFAEQYYAEYGGKEKYEEAAKWLSGRLGYAGINLSEVEIRGLIESALRQFKAEYSGSFEGK